MVQINLWVFFVKTPKIDEQQQTLTVKETQDFLRGMNSVVYYTMYEGMIAFVAIPELKTIILTWVLSISSLFCIYISTFGFQASIKLLDICGYLGLLVAVYANSGLLQT